MSNFYLCTITVRFISEIRKIHYFFKTITVEEKVEKVQKDSIWPLPVLPGNTQLCLDYSFYGHLCMIMSFKWMRVVKIWRLWEGPGKTTIQQGAGMQWDLKNWTNGQISQNIAACMNSPSIKAQEIMAAASSTLRYDGCDEKKLYLRPPKKWRHHLANITICISALPCNDKYT